MNPFQRDQYFLTFNDGESYWSLPKAYEDKVAELAAKLKPKVGDIVRGTTKNQPSPPADYLTPHQSPALTGLSGIEKKQLNSTAPPAYTKGDAKFASDEKGGVEKKSSLKRRLQGSPAKWCKVM